MIKIKLNQLEQVIRSFAAIGAKENNIPQKLSYDLSKRLKALYNEFELYQKEIISCAETLSEGKRKIFKERVIFDISEDNQIKHNKEILELGEKEIELNILPLNLSELKNRDGNDINISAEDFVILSNFIIE